MSVTYRRPARLMSSFQHPADVCRHTDSLIGLLAELLLV